MAPSRSIKRSPRKARKATKSKNNSIFPEHVQAFFARRLLDIYAGILTVMGVFTLLALISYSHTDPSWNTAAADHVSNWMGTIGAWVSDILLQTLGAGSVLIGSGFVIWGVRTFRREQFGARGLRTAALLLSAILASVALAQVSSGDWTVHPYLGSAAGTLLLQRLDDLWSGLGTFGISAIAGLLMVGSFLYAAAVTKAELQMAWAVSRDFAIDVAMLCVSLVGGFVSWIQHYNDPDYQPKKIEVFKNTRAAVKAKPVPKAVVETEAEDDEPYFIEEEPEYVVPQRAGDIPVVTPKVASPQSKNVEQQKFTLSDGEWHLPGLDLIETPPPAEDAGQMDEEGLRRNAELLQNVLADFKVEGDIVSIHPGPVVTLYEFEPAPGTKTSRVVSLSDDIARSMSAVSVRCAVVPGRNVIGIELPNSVRQTVYMQDMLASRLYEKTKAKLPLILGKDIGGQPVMADLAKMPHLLVAGTTGSGKSVAVNTMITSLLYRLPPEKCRFIMIDPKMLELSVYDDIPHLLCPVVTEPGKAVVALKWAVQEMEERYRAMSKLGVRNIEGYNARVKEARDKGEDIMRKIQTGYDSESGKPVYEEQPMDLSELPYIVIIVDEFADLMLVAGKDVESAIQRLAQMARAAGLHLIMATQRPSVDVITGVIKANFPTRISFSVTSKVDSRTILGEGGAEQLLGMGDMLYMAPGGRITRVHGPFVSDEDVEKVTDFLRDQAEPQYIGDVTDEEGDFGDSEILNAMFGGRDSGGDDAVDELYDQAVALVAREGKASTSFVQRYLQIGYNRAARIIEEMERQGVISPATKTGKREVLIRDFSDV